MSLESLPTGNPTLGMLLAQSRVLRALAGGAVLEGTGDELIRRLEVGPEAFRAALHDLVAGGWIFLTTTHDGRLIIGRERRTREAGAVGSPERCRAASLWEGLDTALDA
jgi:hypothetical protein